jgi:hypothetical protein
MQQLEDYRRAHHEYDEVRRHLYSQLEREALLVDGLSIKAGGLWSSLIQEARNWQNRRVEWDWAQLRQDFSGYPARFELTLRVGEVLSALAVGRPSKGKQFLKAYYLEGNPDPQHPLKRHVARLSLRGLELFGEALGCLHARLVSPLTPVIPLYEALGYRAVKGQDGRIYCSKQLRGG